jgi:thiamine kinase-like enzyme
MSDDDLALELPFQGHLCLEVHRGYKVFDLHQNTVTKVFRPDIDLSMIKHEVDRCMHVSSYNFAPVFLECDIDRRWYKEEFINGYLITAYIHDYPARSSNSEGFLNTYYSYVDKNIEDIMLADTPKLISTSEYVNKIIAMFSDRKVPGEFSSDEFGYIRDFLKRMIKKIKNRASDNLYIVLSHGDFGHGHVLDSKQRTRVIDWEYMSYRTALFDFYSCFLEQLFWKRDVPDLVSQIHDSLLSLQVSLKSKAPQIADSIIKAGDMYRLVFYVERVCTDLDYGLNVRGKLRWVNAFELYENMIQKPQCVELGHSLSMSDK